MKIVVFEKDSVMEGGIDYSVLESVADVTYYGGIPEGDISKVIGDSDGVIVNKTIISADIMDRCKNLKYIGTFATGYNNIDVEGATKRGITVCNVPAYSTDGVAQLTISFILYTATSIGDYVASVRNGDWKRSKTFCYYPYYITELAGKTLGIVGFGSIGQRVAEIAKALKMKVIVYSRTKKDSEFPFVSFEELLKTSDYVSLHLPLSKESEKLIDEKAISLMKNSAVLINTARGGLIDETALAKALKAGKIRASCHDVVTFEPMREDCELFGIDNCFITPHGAWAGKETRQRLVDIAGENVKKFLEKTPQNVVNK